MNRHYLMGPVLGCLSLSVSLAQITGGMVDPCIDAPDEPFSYFRQPTDVVGTLLAPVSSEITPEGYVYTGFGELMFFLGNPPDPIDKRIKTLQDGYLPIVKYQIQKEGITYEFTTFAAYLGGEGSGLPVNFVRVRLSNGAQEQRAGFVTSAYRFEAPITTLGGMPDYRFHQRFQNIAKELVEGQSKFNAEWKYDFTSNSVTRDGRVLYWFPTSPQPYRMSLALGDNGLRLVRFFTGEIRGSEEPKHTLNPETPMGVVTYRVQLKPGETQELVFKMPIVPTPKDSALSRAIEAAGGEQQFQATVNFWNEQVVRKMPLCIPEDKVQQFLVANTIYDLLSIDKVGENYIPNVNKFQYHTFYAGGDTCFMMNALDFAGQHDLAGKALLYSLATQREDGAFVMPRDPTLVRYWESFGWTLWGWGSHYALTRDKEFLSKVYPGVKRAVEWQKTITAKDPLGLLPVPAADIADDAFLKSSRQTGQELWVLIGLKNAVRMAEAMGKKDDAADFASYYDRFRAAFDKHLAEQTAKSGGYIPPAMEATLEGNDWDNLHLLWPEPLFDPFDPRVTATIRHSRDQYVENTLDFVVPRAIAKDTWPVKPEGRKQGGYTFEDLRTLHYWQTQNNTHNNLFRGGAEDQQLVVADLYSQLLHTTSTHAPQEFGTYPWSTRDFEGAAIHDILPDGPASAKTIAVIRNMIAAEYQKDLVLLSAVSPSWLQAGKTIEASALPTQFGPLTLTVKADSTGWTMDLANQFWEQPQRMVVSIPWFYEADQILVDGKAVQASQGKVVVTPNVKKIRVNGKIKPGTPEMSFARAVADYKQEYQKRYQRFLQTGETQPGN